MNHAAAPTILLPAAPATGTRGLSRHADLPAVACAVGAHPAILLPFYLGESTQLFRFTLIGEKPRPRISPKSHRATELRIRKTIAHTTDHCREIGTYILYFINRIGGICQVIDYKYYILSLFSGHILWDMTAERILKWIHILLILVF